MRGHELIPLVVVAAGLLACHNGFSGVFVVDVVGSIPDKPAIRHVWSIWQSWSAPR